MLKGVLVGFCWGIVVAISGVVVLSLATTQAEFAMPQGAEMPRLQALAAADEPEPARVAEPVESAAAQGGLATPPAILAPSAQTAQTAEAAPVAAASQAPALPASPSVPPSVAEQTVQAQPDLVAPDVAGTGPVLVGVAAEASAPTVAAPQPVANPGADAVAEASLDAGTVPTVPRASGLSELTDVAVPDAAGGATAPEITASAPQLERSDAVALSVPTADTMPQPSAPLVPVTTEVAELVPSAPVAPAAPATAETAIARQAGPEPRPSAITQIASPDAQITPPTPQATTQARPDVTEVASLDPLLTEDAATPEGFAQTAEPRTDLAPPSGLASVSVPQAVPSVQVTLPDAPVASESQEVQVAAATPTRIETGLPQVSRFGVSAIEVGAAELPLQNALAETDGLPLGALEAGAVAFDSAGSRSLLAIVLRETTEVGVNVDALAALDVPVSVALSPDGPMAQSAAASLRRSGKDVLIDVASLMGPDFTPRLSDAVARLPQAVGFIDQSDLSVQADRAGMDAVLAQMTESGHGLVAHPRGFNAATRSAASNGLRAMLVQRELPDNAAEAARLLDRAAFVAGQQGGAVVVAPASEEMIAAIMVWALADRPENVAIAPVSAVLLAQ